MANHEVIKRLRRDLGSAWDEAKKLNDLAGTESRAFTAEEERIWQMLNSKMSETRERIEDLEEADKREAELDEQREQWESLVRPPEAEKRVADSPALEDAVLSFVRGGMPGAEYAPKSIEIRISGADKRQLHDRIDAIIKRDLSKLTPAAGGNVVPTGFVARLYEHLVEVSGMRQTGSTILTTDSGENLLVPKTTAHGAAALVAENAAIGGTDPAFGQVTLGAFKYGELIRVSNELATDSGINLLDYLARQAGRAIGLASGQHFIAGTGTGQPQGAQAAATVGATAPAGNTTAAHADTLIAVYHSVVSGYRNRAVWLMNDNSVMKVRQLKDTTGQYLWQPGLQSGQPDAFLGRPVVADPFMPVMAANAKSVLFGDFSSFYTIRDVSAVRFERSDDFAFSTDQITFRALLRTDGRVVDDTAVKAYANSAT